MSLRVIVLAAGKGTRMRSSRPKVLFEAAGRPLVSWVLDTVRALQPDETVVVIGHEAEEVAAVLPEGVRAVVQEPQRGTGHAVMAALEAMGPVSADTVLVVPGDSPLIRAESLETLLEVHEGADATVLTAEMSDPFGYGRVVRDDGRVVCIVEERDADDDERAITEVAVSTYAFSGSALERALTAVAPDNAQGEYYLTDVIGLLADGEVRAIAAADADDVQGVNTHEQLAAVGAEMRRRVNARLMDAGVWMLDPGRVYIDAGVEVAPGARLLPGVHLTGRTIVAAGAEVGPDTFVADSVVGPGSRVWYSVVRGAEIGANVQVGPYASLRPGTRLAAGSKAGTFVEVKNAEIGPHSKVPHLSYIGDATIGEDSNVGAGSITCNYDGYDKHHTTIGDRVFIGSDTMLVAPVEIGDDAVTGAGSTITKDVSPGALAVERSQQREVPGYAARRARRAESEEADGP